MFDKGLKNFSETRTVEILRQIRDAFEELRRKGVMHRDLKLTNIFMHNDRAIIGRRDQVISGWPRRAPK